MMEKHEREWSRRKFITTLTGAGAVMILNPIFSWAADETDPRTAGIVARTYGIDVHNHIDLYMDLQGPSGTQINLAGLMKRAGLSAICMTFAVDDLPQLRTGEAYEHFENELKTINGILKRNGMKRSLDLADIQYAQEKRIPTIIQSVEGAHFLEGHLDRLEKAYTMGLRHFTLFHNHDASVPLSDAGGLTTFGKDVIKECNRLGILIDLSYAGNTALDDALKVTTKPVLLSHTGLDTQPGKTGSGSQGIIPGIISKEQAKSVAETGGVIGVWTQLTDTPLEYAANIRAMVDVAGIDHVCIGTDTRLIQSRGAQGTQVYPGAQAITSNPRGQAPSANVNSRDKKPPVEPPKRQGPRQDTKSQDKTVTQHRSIIPTNHIWRRQTTGFYYLVVDALLKTGFTEEEIGKIGSGNYCRIFDAATGKHH